MESARSPDIPSTRSRSRKGAGRQATLTVMLLPPYMTMCNHMHDNAIHASTCWRSGVPHHPAWMEALHGWVPVDTHSTPVPSTEERLWVPHKTTSPTPLASSNKSMLPISPITCLDSSLKTISPFSFFRSSRLDFVHEPRFNFSQFFVDLFHVFFIFQDDLVRYSFYSKTRFRN